ncbi:hypothetical protein Misp06_02926 [Microbulbifer sp. NBRC 101763]|uniref:hypothetical protein n=1 Tax=Microbulbifer sp. NBRC 101763 TaxID=1113820 RepID=UPI0030A9BD7E
MNTPALRANNAPTGVTLSATLDINGSKVPISSQDLSKITTKDLKFSLTQPVVIGSIEDFINWLNDKFPSSIKFETLDRAIKDIPVENIQKALEKLLTAPISVTALSIDTASEYYAFAVTMSMEDDPIEIFSGLQLDSIGVGIASGEEPPDGDG